MHSAHSRRAAPYAAIASLSPTALALTALVLAACADSPVAPSVAGLRAAADRAAATASDGSAATGAVYTLTNAAAGNAVVAYRRATDGTLTPLGTYAAGGLGTGGAVDPLTSQYAVVLSRGHDALFAVDAGSDQVSSFRVAGDGSLTLTAAVASGGARPISLAVNGTLLYVLNTGDNTVSGFRVGDRTRLTPLAGGTRALPAGANGAAAVHFTPDGRYLIVTERLSNRLDVFPVGASGRLGDPVVTAANAGASFGFDVTPRNQPVVSETQGSLTSYALGGTGALTPITASIPTGGKAACWVTITGDGRFAYTTNAGSNFISGFAIDAAGHLTALTPGAPTGDVGVGATPIDLDHVGTRFLYTLEAGRGTIGTFAIDADGTLAARPDTPVGAPASGLQGIAAY